MLFDKPQFSIRLRSKGKARKGRQLYVYREGADSCYRSVSVYTPSALYPLLAQVMKVEPKDAKLYFEQVKDRWVLGVETPDTLYDLWAYTPSKMPAWARRVIK